MLAVHEVETHGDRSQEHQERIAETLDHILRSPKFKDSQQLQSLLRYVVDESVKGNEDALKERLIGIYVFGRRPDYDTTNDPIVRSRMGLLRKRLAQYYESDGGEETGVLIVIPNGTYRPSFHLRPSVPKDVRAKAALAETKHAAAPPSGIVPSATTTPELPAATAPMMELPVVAPWGEKARWKYRVIVIAAVVSMAMLAAWWLLVRPQQAELNALWAPMLKTKQPIYVYTGSMPVYEPGSPEDEASSAKDLYWPIRVPEPPKADLPETGPDHVFSYGEGMLTGSVYADIRVSAFLNKYNRTSCSADRTQSSLHGLEGIAAHPDWVVR